jgi:hypothetical protein
MEVGWLTGWLAGQLASRPQPVGWLVGYAMPGKLKLAKLHEPFDFTVYFMIAKLPKLWED